MKFWYKIIKSFLIVSVLLLSVVQADTLHQLSQLLVKVNSISAKFTQHITDAQGIHLSTSQGNLLVRKPGYFKWQIERPNKQLIIVKHGKVYMLQNDLQQLTIRHFNVNATQTPATLLLNGNYQVLAKQYTAHKDKHYNDVTFTLLPKDQNAILKSIKLSFHGDVLRSLSLADHFNRITTIVFSDYQENINISPAQFQFVVPKGTDIIHE